jgi:nucleoside-diphosphate-sugar epimerase
MSMKVLITGANGFLGKCLTYALAERGYSVLGAVRRAQVAPCAVPLISVAQINAKTDWRLALANCEAVIHTAAHVHIQRTDSRPGEYYPYRSINVDGTLRLARQAADLGVKRFIFISTIKVNGERTLLGHPFYATDLSLPHGPYATSKWEAEVGLREISQQTGMEVVIIRPPLIYGPGVKGNFQALVRLISKGIPLPFGCLSSNRRSFVGVDNLISLIALCLTHPSAANQTFLVSDNEDVPTAELLKRIGNAVGRSPVLLPVPLNYLNWIMRLLRKSDAFEKITGTLQVDITATCERLGWQPTVSLNDGLLKLASEALSEKAL